MLLPLDPVVSSYLVNLCCLFESLIWFSTHRYISPEQVPVQYGGLSVDSCDCNPDSTISDPATDMTIKPGTKQIVEIIIYEV